MWLQSYHSHFSWGHSPGCVWCVPACGYNNITAISLGCVWRVPACGYNNITAISAGGTHSGVSGVCQLVATIISLPFQLKVLTRVCLVCASLWLQSYHCSFSWRHSLGCVWCVPACGYNHITAISAEDNHPGVSDVCQLVATIISLSFQLKTLTRVCLVCASMWLQSYHSHFSWEHSPGCVWCVPACGYNNITAISLGCVWRVPACGYNHITAIPAEGTHPGVSGVCLLVATIISLPFQLKALTSVCLVCTSLPVNRLYSFSDLRPRNLVPSRHWSVTVAQPISNSLSIISGRTHSNDIFAAACYCPKVQYMMEYLAFRSAFYSTPIWTEDFSHSK